MGVHWQAVSAMQASDDIQLKIAGLRTESQDLCAQRPIAGVILKIDRASDRDADAAITDLIERLLSEGPEQYGEEEVGAYAKLLVLTLILDMAARLERIKLPQAIKDIYPEKLAHIANGIQHTSHAQYITETGRLRRDLRIAFQLSVPLGGSRYIDRHTYLNHNFYRYKGKWRNLACLSFILTRLRGLGPLFRVHIDDRDLTDFDPAGWDVSYLRAAEMLRMYPQVRGLVGTSWVLDPKLDEISPALGVSRRHFVAEGAFLREDGPGENHTEPALRKSATRRRLYEEGKYIPSCYTFLWARADILKWAARVSSTQAK
jgi:hypothetical protein